MDSFTAGRITGHVVFWSLLAAGGVLAHRAAKRSERARLAAMQQGAPPWVPANAGARVILVRAPDGTTQTMNEHFFAQAVASGQLHPMTPASIDRGQTFLAASVIAARLSARGDDGIALLLPTRIETLSAVAGYLAIFSLLFFGGPLTFAAVIISSDNHPSIGVRLGVTALALLLGPLPPGLLAILGLRALRRDPTYRGKGRAVFALVVAGLMLLGCVVALVRIAIASVMAA